MESADELLQEVEVALRSLVSRISSPPATATTSVNSYDDAILAMENILQRLIVLQPLLSVNFPGITGVIQRVRTLVVELNAVEDEAQRQARRCIGRPEIVITEPELRNLLELQFTQVEISKLYGCSPRTIRRRILSFRLQQFVNFSDISDQELDTLISRFVVRFPSAG